MLHVFYSVSDPSSSLYFSSSTTPSLSSSLVEKTPASSPRPSCSSSSTLIFVSSSLMSSSVFTPSFFCGSNRTTQWAVPQQHVSSSQMKSLLEVTTQEQSPPRSRIGFTAPLSTSLTHPLGRPSLWSWTPQMGYLVLMVFARTSS